MMRINLFLLKYLTFIVITLFTLPSCNPNSYIFKDFKYELTKEDKELLLDSVKIVKVVDNRPEKSSIIGYARKGRFNDTVPFIMKTPLDDYLYNSFNTLVSKTTLKNNSIPVTVYINDFNTNFNIKHNKEYLYHKYSYLFEYPLDSVNKKKVQIIDSIFKDVDDFPYERLSILIKSGVKKASQSFIKYYNDNKHSQYQYLSSDSIINLSHWESNNLIQDSAFSNNKIKIDSIDFSKIKINKIHNKSKSGVYLNYCKGYNVDYGLRIAYLSLEQKDNSVIEFGYNIGFTYYSIKPKNYLKDAFFLGFNSGFIIRINQSSDPKVFFLNGGLYFTTGLEKIKNGYNNTEKNNFFFGPTLEESIGFNLGGSGSITFGLYQLLHLGSDILPSDYGFIFSLSVTNSY